MSIELKGLSSRKPRREANALILNGVEGVAEITRAEQTGVFINEQPEIHYSMHYVNKKGETHYSRFKKTTALTDMHQYALGAVRPILYLESDPEVFILL